MNAHDGSCVQCGQPIARRSARFCCLGCEIAAAVGGGSGEGFAPGRLLARIGLAAFLSMNVMMIAFALWGATPAGGPVQGWVSLLRWLSLLLTAPALAILVPPLVKAGFSRAGGARLRVELLVVAASLAAFAISTVNTVRERGPVWFDTATMVLLVVTLGSWLAARARTQARDDLRRLFTGSGARFRVERDGASLEVAEQELCADDLLALDAGARVPVDGVVVRSRGARLDASLLTGEPMVRPVVPADRVRAGEVVRAGALDLVATAVGSDSTLGRLRAALERALARPPRIARAVDGLAQLLVATTALLAIALVARFAVLGQLEVGLTRALALLTVACPCSLGLAAPLTLTRALGAAAGLGAVVQSLDGFERLGRVDRLAADKTGTLTTGDAGSLVVERSEAAAADPREIDALLAALSSGSQHPIAQALRESLRDVAPEELDGLRELPGAGLVATDRHQRNLRLARAIDPDGAGLRSELTRDGERLATITLHERPRPGVESLGRELAARGIDLVVLSGDDSRRAESFARSLGATGRGGLRPEEKATELEALRRGRRGVALLGDGANDAVALAGADVSIVVDRKLEWLADAADVVLLGDRVGRLPEIIDLARRARRRVLAGLSWAALYHAVTLTLGAVGWLSPAAGALLMAAGSLAVVSAASRPLTTLPTAPPGSLPAAAPRTPRGVASPALAHDLEGVAAP